MGLRRPYGAFGGVSLPSWDRFWANTGLQLAYYSGAARILERRKFRAGAIIRFAHVRPARRDAFQPLRSDEITPEFLDRAIRAMRRWDYDFVSIGEVASRAQTASASRRSVCLTFDGAWQDFMPFAYPVLSHHRVPFAVYVPTGFVDGIGQAWWLALELIVARNSRIALVMNGTEQRFNAISIDQKYELYDLLYGWLRSLSWPDLSAAIGELCKRYGVDLKAVSSNVSMTWPDLVKLSQDPMATIGCATVAYAALSAAKGSDALREMTMSKSVIEAALDIECSHFAYPYGDRESFSSRDTFLAHDAGFATAVSTRAGFVRADGKANVFALPRISWDGRRKSIGALRAVMSGVSTRKERDQRQDSEQDYG